MPLPGVVAADTKADLLILREEDLTAASLQPSLGPFPLLRLILHESTKHWRGGGDGLGVSLSSGLIVVGRRMIEVKQDQA